MTRLEVAIIADDLSGALDAAAPFAARGFTTEVAISADHLGDMAEPAVAAVSTASRHLPPDAAGARVRQAALALAGRSPRIVFRKIDSRLKGNLESETRALLEVFPRSRLLVAPAVPALGRRVVEGFVIGAGITDPLPLRRHFGGLGLVIEAPDAMDQMALDALAEDLLAAAADVLAIGARGLAEGLARQLSRGRGAHRSPVAGLPAPFAIVIGSRDPITLGQVECLLAASPDLVMVTAPDGAIEDRSVPLGASVLFLCTGTGGEAPQEVARRFAEGVAAYIHDGDFAGILASGGDTAAALMAALGVGLIHPRGEVSPGIPWSHIALGPGETVALITKSGGFGHADLLAGLAGRAMTASPDAPSSLPRRP